MKICFPALDSNGLDSEMSGHFGSAPFFLIVDTDTSEVSPLGNDNKHHEHGQCNPVAAFANSQVDVAVVSGIGAGAISKLGMHKIAVYQGATGTIGDNVELFKEGKLSLLDASHACGGHSHDDGHSHDGSCSH